MASTVSRVIGCEVTESQLLPCLERLSEFLDRYTPLLSRVEQHGHATTYMQGLLSNLPRKTVEPIATAHDQERRNLQRFVGEGGFDDDALVEELKKHVAEEIGDPSGVLIIDPTCVAKKGVDSVGVKHQWNGRLGKEDNCQKGVLLGYATPQGLALVDRALYLPEDWASDPVRRAKCHVPEEVTFKTSWQLGLDLIERSRRLPHSWIVADDEFGRPTEFRAALRERGERYALDVPSNTIVRPVHAPPPPKRSRKGRPPGPRALRVSDWARERKSGAWVRILLRDGTKGPMFVQATEAVVETRLDGKLSQRERLVVIRSLAPQPEYWYVLTNAGPEVSIGAIVCAVATRHSIETAIQYVKGEAGLAQYEVRSWVGWHHHVTFSLLACWFLMVERRRFRDWDPNDDGTADSQSRRSLAAQPENGSASHRKADYSSVDSERGVSNEPLAKDRSRATRSRNRADAVS